MEQQHTDDPEAIARSLDGQTYNAQVKRMIALGREAAAGDAAARQTLAAMAGGDAWARRLSLFACFTSGDGVRALEATQDPSARVRSLAFRAAPYACDDDQALRALQLAWEVRRDRHLAVVLHRKGRQVVVDRFVDWLVSEGHTRSVVDLLPLTSEAGAQRHWALAVERASQTLWKQLARRHPRALAEHLRARVEAGEGEPDPVDRQLIERHQRALVEGAPDAALQLVEALLARDIQPQHGAWMALARRRPRAALALMREQPALRTRGALAHAHLEVDELVEVTRLAPWLLGDAAALRARLDAAARRAVARAWAEAPELDASWGGALLEDIEDATLRTRAAQAWSVAARDADGRIPLGVVEALPRDLGEVEARRHLNEVVALQPWPLGRIPYARLLDWEEAREALDAWLGHPEGGTRGASLSVLLCIPGRRLERPELVARALDLVVQRRFEQDPVRQVMFQALLGWPRACWRPEHLPAVGQALRDALDASDLSYQTASVAERLVVRLFGVDTAWGARWLATLVAERGGLRSHRLGEHLSDDEVRASAPELLRIAKAWRQRERNGPLIELAQSLGARLQRVDGLTALLVEVALDSVWRWDALSIVGVLREHAPDEALRLVEALLERGYDAELTLQLGHSIKAPLPERLVARLVEVARRASRDWTPGALGILRHKALEAFNALLPELLVKDRSFICMRLVHDHIHRHRQDLLDVVLDPAPVTGRFATGQTRWLIPFRGGFFRWMTRHNAAYERALEQVVDDAGQGTPTRLDAIARLASLFSVEARGLRAAAAHETPVVQEKAIRVLARLDAGQGLATLIECLGDARARFAIYGLRGALLQLPASRAAAILGAAPRRKVTVVKEVVRLLGELRSEAAYHTLLKLDSGDLHRDVRVALLRALWDHLEREPTWAIMRRAATGADVILAGRVGDVPADRLTPTSDRRLSALLAEVLERPEPEARVALMQRAAALSVRDPERTLWGACVARLRSPFDAEARAAMQALLWRSYEHDLCALEPALEALIEDRRALDVALTTLIDADPRRRALWQGMAAAAERVARHPELAGWRVRCAAAWREPGDLADWLCAQAEQGALDFDAMDAARAAISALPPTSLSAVGERLQRSASAQARRLAVVALIHDAAPGRGWSRRRLARLARLQGDPSPIVAGAARLVFPPREADVAPD